MFGRSSFPPAAAAETAQEGPKPVLKSPDVEVTGIQPVNPQEVIRLDDDDFADF